MTLNPISFADQVNRQFLRYQLTAFPLSDPDLSSQAREMLGGFGESSQLVKGPYISLSRPFAEGALLDDLVIQGKLHPAVAGIAEHPRMFAHQQAVYEAYLAGKHCLVSTGTGSGKTESFLYPILDHCFRLRDAGAPPGIVAIIVYPMNALAIDQLERLRHLLAGTGITFGLYIGSTPETEAQLTDIDRMKKGEGREQFTIYREKLKHHPNVAIAPFEERLTEAEMRAEPPRILLTNVNQLEFLMTRIKDIPMFESAPLRFIVFDEAHTYSGSRGAEVAVLIRRLRAFCNKTADDVICIGTSATILDPKQGEQTGVRFAHRFFGVDPKKVALATEKYEAELWPSTQSRAVPMGDEAPTVFREVLAAIDGEGDAATLGELLSRFGKPMDEAIPWREGLYESLSRIDVIQTIHERLDRPMHLNDATRAVWKRLRRRPPAESNEIELLTWLALGAAAEKEGHPLLRPQLHYFIRGLGGATAVLADETEAGYAPARLYFSRSVAAEKNPNVRPEALFPVVSCKICGQHFFELWMDQIDETSGLSGGLAEEDNVCWPRTPEKEGAKITFTNRFISEIDDDEGDIGSRLDKKRETAFLCQFCGTLHLHASDSCLNPSCGMAHRLIPVFVLGEHGDVKTCPSCRYHEGRFTSPLRPMSAVQVADVHILAQEMLNGQNKESQKLIVFSDNRQEAAFQAAWMADHARRYRLRHLIYRSIENAQGPISIGDIVDKLNKFLRENKDLARAVAPEVFANAIEERYSTKVERDMKRFLRITIIRELVTGFSQRDSLETWGKIRVVYPGIDETDTTVQQLAQTYNIAPHALASGIGGLLDTWRRSNLLYDEFEPIFSHYWHPGHEEIQRGFLPLLSFPPQGLKLLREDGDSKQFVKGVTSAKGLTSAEHFVRRWGIDEDQVKPFLNDLWAALTDTWQILSPVILRDGKNRPLPDARGVFQIDSKQIGIVSQHIRYRCHVCNRFHSREAPKRACSKIHCRGRTTGELPPDDDYNVSLLSRDFIMLVAREHTAQVPADDRQFIEKEFKRTSGSVNCLVATPTLELGIDVGSLDVILMRNVPPLTANYWQRAGRAGRRHRMAVIYTYAAKKAHDEYFFADPIRLLSGSIFPPRLNLRNPVMIQKHVHATVLSELIRMGHGAAYAELSPEGAGTARTVLEECLPPFVSGYLFEEGREYREDPPDLSELGPLIATNAQPLLERIKHVFSDYWPEDSSIEVDQALLSEYLDSTAQQLVDQVGLIHQRLMWAIVTRNKLTQKEQQVAKLDDMEERLLQRCKAYIDALLHRSLDTYTLNVLGRGGYLPGYATDQGTISGFASKAYSSSWKRITFEISRPHALALREFIPGNLIYANGGKYKVAWYHLAFDESRLDPQQYLVDATTLHVTEEGRAPDGYVDDQLFLLPALPISDTELGFMSHVSDAEENRFRMPAAVGGLIQEEHRGIDHYTAGDREFAYHHGQKLRLINVGPTDKVRGRQFGYPLCIVCGAARSPYASEAEFERFIEDHKKSCGRSPERMGLSADAQADGLYFTHNGPLADAINLAEGLRLAANVSLEMEPEDLQLLLITESDDEHRVFIYDPMPGGSGIIDQLIDGWAQILGRGIASLQNCAGACSEACYDCLKTYRNALYHPLLNRRKAVELLEGLRHDPQLVLNIPPNIETGPPSGQSTNTAEARLSAELQSYGFPPFDRQKKIALPGSLVTMPDFYYESADEKKKIALYLDGLSKNIHGNKERQKKDHYIRTVLGSQNVHVEEIASSALDDPSMLRLHLLSVAQRLGREDIVKVLQK